MSKTHFVPATPGQFAIILAVSEEGELWASRLPIVAWQIDAAEKGYSAKPVPVHTDDLDYVPVVEVLIELDATTCINSEGAIVTLEKEKASIMGRARRFYAKVAAKLAAE